MPPSAAPTQYPCPSGVAAAPTTGARSTTPLPEGRLAEAAPDGANSPASPIRSDRPVPARATPVRRRLVADGRTDGPGGMGLGTGVRRNEHAGSMVGDLSSVGHRRFGERRRDDSLLVGWTPRLRIQRPSRSPGRVMRPGF